MKAVLFVSNGHGETAIAARIARETEKLSDERQVIAAHIGQLFGQARERLTKKS